MEQPERSLSLAAAPEGAVEGEVINQNVYGAIRALAEQGESKKGIARQLGLDVKTVRTWLKRPWRVQTRRARGRQLDAWREFLRARAPEVGFNAVVLTREGLSWRVLGPGQVHRGMAQGLARRRPADGALRDGSRGAGSGRLGVHRALPGRGAGSGAPVHDGAGLQPADLRQGLSQRRTRPAAGWSCSGLRPLRGPDAEHPLRQPQDDRDEQGRGSRARG